MKKILSLTLFAAAAALFAQTATNVPADAKKAPTFKKVKLQYTDYNFPSTKGVMGWCFHGRDYEGIMELVTEDGAKVLKVTPKETEYSKKTSKTLRAICRNTSPFKVDKDDVVKYDVEFKGEPGATIGFILSDGRRNQWVKWLVKCNGKWQKGTYTMVVKNAIPKSFFAIDVCHKSVMLKPVTVSVQKGAK